MFLYNDVYYKDKNFKTALKPAETHGSKITFHENCRYIHEDFASDNDVITDVVFSKKIERIGFHAFACCKNLKTVKFNDYVTYIYQGAFMDTALTSISLPGSLEYMVSEVFANCKNLKSINFAGTSVLKAIQKKCFSNCGIEQLNLPDSIEAIQSDAFANCKNLKSIHIGKNVEYIASDAFVGCVNVDEINIDSENKNYDSRDNCNAIIATDLNNLIFGNKHTTIPDSVAIIGENAFRNSDIERIDLPSSVEKIRQYAFTDTPLKEITFPKNLKLIDNYAFANCVVKNIDLPDSVRNIGKQAFYNCKSLESVKWSKKAKHMEYATFGNCTSLKEISNLENVKEINAEVFKDCAKLNNIVLGEKIEYIGFTAFQNCNKLLSIDIPYNPNLFIASSAFANSAIFNKDMKNKGYFAVSDILLKIRPKEELIIPEGIKKIVQPLYLSSEDMELVKSVTLPSTLLEISESAFRDFASLEHVNFNEGLEVIGPAAFMNSGLYELHLPSTLKQIGKSAFRDCPNLHKVAPFNFKNDIEIGPAVFSKTAINNTQFFKHPVIPKYCFDNCKNLYEVYIHPQVKEIGESAFGNSSVERMFLYKDLKKVGFLGYLPHIKEIFFLDTSTCLEDILDAENIKAYHSKIKSLDNLEEIIDSNIPIKIINKFYKNIEEMKKDKNNDIR